VPEERKSRSFKRSLDQGPETVNTPSTIPCPVSETGNRTVSAFHHEGFDAPREKPPESSRSPLARRNARACSAPSRARILPAHRSGFRPFLKTTARSWGGTMRGCWKWSPLRQEPEAPLNNATSRGLRRITPGRSRGIASRGIQFCRLTPAW
jgi:hypothetical protein